MSAKDIPAMAQDVNRHLGGIPWWKAPAPPADHEHWAQTTGMLGPFEQVERCACGAIRSNVSPRWCLLDAPRVAPQPTEALRVGRFRRLLRP